ncbi:hypothetical protein KSP39_PZI018681 [Platanthera zijinensis]|uniref:Uncharacterized protein n=1 Tax=Platanthera zijinensis TaxID=2320716 RepID=A0AAP0B498_9ASPA
MVCDFGFSPLCAPPRRSLRRRSSRRCRTAVFEDICSLQLPEMFSLAASPPSVFLFPLVDLASHRLSFFVPVTASFLLVAVASGISRRRKLRNSTSEDFDTVPGLLRSIGFQHHHLGFLLASIPSTDGRLPTTLFAAASSLLFASIPSTDLRFAVMQNCAANCSSAAVRTEDGRQSASVIDNGILSLEEPFLASPYEFLLKSRKNHKYEHDPNFVFNVLDLVMLGTMERVKNLRFIATTAGVDGRATTFSDAPLFSAGFS